MFFQEVLVVIIRKHPNVDMVPAQFTAGILAAIIGYFIAGKLLMIKEVC